MLSKSFSKSTPYSDIYATFILLGRPEYTSHGDLVSDAVINEEMLKFGMYAFNEALSNS